MKRVLLLVLVLLNASCAKIEAEQELGQTPDSGTSTDTDTDVDTDTDADTDTDTDTSPVECDDSEDCGGDPCVDGYCCDDACDGACEACDITGFEGICTSYPNGVDPEDDCSDAGPSSCGENGVCNGVSGCALFPSGVVCDDLEPCTSDDQCDGLGTCEGLVPTDCDPGAGNECCAGACSTTAGCYTIDDGCDDNCGTNNITKSENCLGCGPAQGVGICSGGSVHTCNDFSHILCEEVSCDGTTYYCTNDGGSWEWRSLVLCDDGDDCTVSDACWGGSCIGTVYSCPSDDCTTRACDGLGACIETHEPSTTVCGTTTCPTDYCNLGSWWDYPPDCTSYCDGAGTCVDCTCSAAETVCSDGSICCEAACLDVGGCFTVTGTCGTGDVCTDSNILYVDSVCSGCGPMGAAGVCGGGGTFICNDTQHNSCEIVSCGGTTHYCTNESGNWQWELTPDCDDGDLCTYEDTCGAGGTCLGTPITCTDTDCLSSTCDGTENCFEVPMTVAVSCGTTTCMADYCSAGSWYNYPPDCTSYCDGSGSCDPCTCTVASTVCDVGATNECCLSTCNPVLGCGTNPGNCDGTDECTDPTTLVTSKSCLGCSLNLANGVCGNGTSHVCDSSASCDVVTCDTDTYYCTNFGGTWEWRLGNNQCNDGNPCTYGDYCDSGTCSGTVITCTSDACTSRACNGTNTCTEANEPATTSCGTTTCPVDFCGSGDWYDYPGACTSYCDGAGTCNSCTCTTSTTVCDVGSTNQCCVAECNATSGCSTIAGSCGSSDVCTATSLTVGQSCNGCGPNNANGVCGSGATYTCDAANECDVQACGGTTYYCTNAGGTWEWETSSVCNDGDLCTYGDTCGGGTCSGTAVTCNTPSPDECVSNVLWSYYSPGTCSGGICSYPHTATACDNPPADTCVGNTAWNYSASGTCVVDHCVYSHTETVCPHTCNLGVCEGCAMGSNVAPSATGTISSGSTDQVTYGPGKLNDGGLQSGCGFCWIYTGTSYGGGAYFQYTWGTPQTLWGMWVDTEPSYGSGCAYTGGRGLEGGDVQWWNGSAWVTDGTVTGQTDDWAYYEFTSSVTTTAVRIYNAYAMATANAVIFEWRVYSCL